MSSPFLHRFYLTLDYALSRIADAFEFTRGRILPGSFINRVYPRLTVELLNRIKRGHVLITGINGKSTTSHLLALILQQADYETLHTETGAQTVKEITAALLEAAMPSGAIQADYGVFGVHDTELNAAVRLLAPHTILMNNLYRDGVEREAGVETVVRVWRDICRTLRPDHHLLLNADDPFLTGEVTRGVPAQITYFGVEDIRLETTSRAAGLVRCHRCGALLRYRHIVLSHLGDYHCIRCDWERPMPTIYAINVELKPDGTRFRIITPVGPLDVDFRLPGVNNVYNAVAATSAAVTLGITAANIRKGLERARPLQGRGETVTLDQKTTRLMLITNPTATHEALRTALLDTSSQHYVLLIDHETDAAEDVSWIWEVDFESLSGRAASVVVSGPDADHLVLRLKHAGVEVTTVILNPETAFQQAMERLPQNGVLWVMATPAALSELRVYLVNAGMIGIDD